MSLSTSLRTVAACLAMAIGGCARIAADDPQRAQMLSATALDTTDPLEQSNRGVLDANVGLYRGVERPLIGAYEFAVPAILRNRVTDGINNLGEPRIFINDLLQLRVDSASKTLGRFILNSTVGIGGLIDVATQAGLPRQTGDFGQTLYVWGVSSGPYLVLPVFGPSTVRDAFGKAVDEITDPGTFAVARVGGLWPSQSVGAIGSLQDTRDFDDILVGSLDPYPRLRSFYLQRRASQLGDAVGVTINPQTEPAPDISPPPEAVKPPKPPKKRAKTVAKRPLVQPGVPSSVVAFSRSARTSASGPPEAMMDANSLRRDATSLMLPSR
jgi:phospholipid-binding lipoprotein MlaA